MKASEFYTVPRSESGIEVKLLAPDGSDTGATITIIGPDSKAFKAAIATLRGSNAEIGGIEDTDEREAKAGEHLLAFRVALVKAWTLDDEFTPDNVRALLVNAPRLADQIDGASGDVSRFFGLASANSLHGQPSSDAPGQETLDLQPSA